MKPETASGTENAEKPVKTEKMRGKCLSQTALGHPPAVQGVLAVPGGMQSSRRCPNTSSAWLRVHAIAGRARR
jgi:hypothetical protein